MLEPDEVLVLTASVGVVDLDQLFVGRSQDGGGEPVKTHPHHLGSQFSFLPIPH